MPAQADTSRMAKALLTTDERELVDRATLLPIGQYDDGSLTFAWPQFLKDAWEGGQRTFHQGRQLPRVDDTGNYVGTPRAENVDGLNVASMAPTAGVAGRMAGAVPRGALGSGGSDMVTKPKGITAYHGSPHDFDKFDLSKIGTGEGAQAYGHGLYFAEAEGVARMYRDQLSGAIPDDVRGALKTVDNLGFNSPGTAHANARAHSDWMKRWDVDPARSPQEAAAAEVINRHLEKPRGRMYEVRINADPNDFLDWDKPLSQQSDAVRNAVGPIVRKAAEKELQRRGYQNRRNDANIRETIGKEPPARPAEPTLDELAERLLGNEFAKGNEAALREAGIPGIRYLDQGSRGAGDGTYNYVMFDDALIDIMRKYANPETAALPGLMSFGSEPGGLLAGEPQQGLPPLLKRRY